MKVKFYLITLVYFLSMVSVAAQDCNDLSLTYTSLESRCVATGSISIFVNGGSGNYNYKAIGPVSTPTTSTSFLSGLPSGYYKLIVKDLTTGCTIELDSAFVPGSYSDPRFQLTKTDAGCAGNDGSLSVINQQFGRSPFTYTIISPSPSNVGATNFSGIFTALTPGEYVVQLQDSCGGIQVRRITIENYNWWLDSVSVVRSACVNAAVYIRLKDNKGNVNTTGSAFSAFTYGYILTPGDTTWNGSHQFNVVLGTKRSLVLVVKDNCGNVKSTVWHLPPTEKPSLGSVTNSNLACTNFTASVTGVNLTSPQYCLYSSTNVLIGCNTTGQFTNLAYGSYCISMQDACYDTTITRCFTVNQPVPAVASAVSIFNKNCSTFTARITGQQNLISPQYCLYSAADILVSCNATGTFNSVPYGSYCIRITDGCTGTVIVRCFTVSRPTPVLTGYTISGNTCSAFNVVVTGDSLNAPSYCLYDNLGNLIICNSTGVFTGVPQGSYCIRAFSCGDPSNSLCFTNASPVPSVNASVQIADQQCSTFSASVTGQVNLTSPQYCLYTSTNTLVACNSTGNFQNIPYGDYCIRIDDGCVDTIISRCFTVTRPVPSVTATMNVLSSLCNTVSFRVAGTNLMSPEYCLYDADDNLLECNTTGIFNNYAFGSYCVVIEDDCYDTTFRVCGTFAPLRGISLTTSKSCAIGKSYIDVQFSNTNAPFAIRAYHPNGSQVAAITTSANPYRLELSGLPAGIQYKIIGEDNCGNIDSSFIAPDANQVSKSITVRSKCPGAAWLNGAGDILSTCSSNYHSLIPQIIRKNGTPFVSGYSSVTANVYTFSDLEPAQYIIEYTQQFCNGKLYDTVVVSPYTYPSQGQSAIYQCDNNSFSLGADVQGGVTPYNFQIIGSMPETPHIGTVMQASPVFTINTGTTYSLVRLRSIDACGNATLNDVSILPLQNVSIAASQLCFFQNVTLSVDTIPNAVYSWYRKITPVDSVLVGTGLNYSLPFFMPSEAGDYVCKVVVNDGCITRLSRFTLDGDCDHHYLPVSFELKGKKLDHTNQLSWAVADQATVVKYSIERKRTFDGGFISIGTIPVQPGGNYVFNDSEPGNGLNLYRLKINYPNKSEYTNIVSLNSTPGKIEVYPNPAKDKLTVSFATRGNYTLDLFGTAGQLLYTKGVGQESGKSITIQRTMKMPAGMYLLRIKNTDTGNIEIMKVLFE